MKKIIIKKSSKFKVFYLKVKTALFNNKKLIVINNYNVLNLKSKELNKTLQTKLINSNVIRGLKLKFPVSGLSKIIKFKTLSELNNVISTLATNKTFFDVVLIKVFDRLYNLSKFTTLFLKPTFLLNKVKFLNFNLVNHISNFNFFYINFFSSVLNFITILNNK